MTSSAGWSAAAHLVRSTGFGASGDLVDAVAAAGPSAWLQASLRAAPESDPGAAAAPSADVRGGATGGPGRLDGAEAAAPQAGRRPGDPAHRLVDPPDGRRAEPGRREADLRLAQPLRDVGDQGEVRTDAAGAERHPARQGSRHLHRPGRGDGRGPGPAVLARRPAEHRQGAQREPLARVHGAVHPRPRGRLHRAGRPRGGASAHRLDARPLDRLRGLRRQTARRQAQDRPRHHGEPRRRRRSSGSSSTSRPRRRSSRPGGGSSSPGPRRHRPRR